MASSTIITISMSDPITLLCLAVDPKRITAFTKTSNFSWTFSAKSIAMSFVVVSFSVGTLLFFMGFFLELLLCFSITIFE